MRSIATLASALLLTLAACSEQSPQTNRTPAPEPPAAALHDIECTIELRSWIVAGRGRHLYLECDCPDPYDHLNTRIEYTKLTLRTDHDRPVTSYTDLVADAQNPQNRGSFNPQKNTQNPAENPQNTPRIEPGNIARMTPGRRLWPIIQNERDRLEATYKVPLATAKSLQRDRVFTIDYALLGPNSNSGIRKVMEEHDLRLPPRILAGEGAFGEYPGITMHPGDDLDPADWHTVGLTRGPVTLVRARTSASTKTAGADAPATTEERAYP